jgi:hypothetical protein
MSDGSDVEVDILISADYYWKFITAGTTKCGAKPGTVRTCDPRESEKP